MSGERTVAAALPRHTVEAAQTCMEQPFSFLLSCIFPPRCMMFECLCCLADSKVAYCGWQAMQKNGVFDEMLNIAGYCHKEMADCNVWIAYGMTACYLSEGDDVLSNCLRFDNSIRSKFRPSRKRD